MRIIEERETQDGEEKRLTHGKGLVRQGIIVCGRNLHRKPEELTEGSKGKEVQAPFFSSFSLCSKGTKARML